MRELKNYQKSGKNTNEVQFSLIPKSLTEALSFLKSIICPVKNTLVPIN